MFDNESNPPVSDFFFCITGFSICLISIVGLGLEVSNQTFAMTITVKSR